MTMSGLRQEAAENTQNKFKDVSTTTTTPPPHQQQQLSHIAKLFICLPKKSEDEKAQFVCDF
jgi:hypothetical protein